MKTVSNYTLEYLKDDVKKSEQMHDIKNAFEYIEQLKPLYAQIIDNSNNTIVHRFFRGV